MVTKYYKTKYYETLFYMLAHLSKQNKLIPDLIKQHWISNIKYI